MIACLRSPLEEDLFLVPTVKKRSSMGETSEKRCIRGGPSCLKSSWGQDGVTRESSERKDFDILQVLVGLGPDLQVPANLRVDVRIKVRVEKGEIVQRRH
jgi:hypothetical protein